MLHLGRSRIEIPIIHLVQPLHPENGDLTLFVTHKQHSPAKLSHDNNINVKTSKKSRNKIGHFQIRTNFLEFPVWSSYYSLQPCLYCNCDWLRVNCAWLQLETCFDVHECARSEISGWQLPWVEAGNGHWQLQPSKRGVLCRSRFFGKSFVQQRRVKRKNKQASLCIFFLARRWLPPSPMSSATT